MFSKGNVYLCVADTFLVIQKSEEKFIHIYSTNTYKLLGEFGSKGKGPGEFLSPSLLKEVGHNTVNDSPVIYIFDFKRQILSTINILNALNGIDIEKQERLPGSNFLPYFFYKDQNFYVASPALKGRFQIYNYKMHKTSFTPYIPKLSYPIPGEALPTVYRSSAYVNLKRGLIVSAPLFLGELDFFDLDGSYIRSTVFEPRDAFKEELKAGTGSMKNTKYQIEDIDAKGGLIYGLNYNNSIKDFYKPSRKENVKVQVFDWNGKPVKEYHLDNRLITSFAIDSVHNRIYAYSPNEKEHTVITYSMK